MEVAGHFEAVGLAPRRSSGSSNVRIVKNAESASPIMRYHLWRGQLDLRYELWDQGR